MGMSIITINAEIQASCKVCYLFQMIADIKSRLSRRGLQYNVFLKKRKIMDQMNRRTMFFGAIVIAVLSLALSVYYIIPGIYHPLTVSPPFESHPTHAVAFFFLVLICVVGALVTRPKPAAR